MQTLPSSHTLLSPFHSAPHPHAPLATRPQPGLPCPHKGPLSEAIKDYYNGDVPTGSVKSHDKKAIFDKFFEDHSDDPTLQAKNERQQSRLWSNARVHAIGQVALTGTYLHDQSTSLS